jgi:hypothetical protein
MNKTHFGYQTVDEAEKAGKVAEVFNSVANKYDNMNDLMSGGLHRLWKHFTISKAAVKPGQKVLDIAGGTGDLSLSFAKSVGLERETGGQVWLTDINASMLGFGRNRLIDKGYHLPCVQVDAEQIPFPDSYFDLTTVGGKQDFRKWFTSEVRNEIRSYTPEALGVSTSLSVLESVVNDLAAKSITLVANAAALPTVVVPGQMVLQLNTSQLKVWNGSVWVIT